MTGKQIIIDDIKVSELTSEQLACMNRYEVAHLFIKLVETLSRTEDDYNKAQEDRVRMWTDITGLTKRLKRKEKECGKYKKALDNVEFICIGLLKQLKRKKQECEEKQKTAQDAISKLCAEKSALYNEIDQFKVENEELKKNIMYKCPQCGDEYLSPIGASLYEENNKLKQILTEIKEIAENAEKQCVIPKNYFKRNNVSWKQHQLKGLTCKFQQILQKICDCEVENDNRN